MRTGLLIATLVLGSASCSDPGGRDAPGAGGSAVLDAALPDAGSDGHAHDDAGADAADAAPPFTGPGKLSETGLYQDIASRTLAPGVRPYGVRYELWSDGAAKNRFVYLPPGTQIDGSSMDWWKFPIGTKAWKEFVVGGKLIETRLLLKQAEGPDGWLEVAYVWDAAGSDAVAAPAGASDVLGSYDVPSIGECRQCHDGAGDVLLGVSAIQLGNPDGTGFLSTLTSEDLIAPPPSAEPDVPGDGVVEAALGYLHANCGHCHNGVNGLAQKRALRLRLSVTDPTPEETPTYQTSIGAPMSHVLAGTTIAIVPGKPLESQLYVRMLVRDLTAMPPLGTAVVDDSGAAAIAQWIAALPPK